MGEGKGWEGPVGGDRGVQTHSSRVKVKSYIIQEGGRGGREEGEKRGNGQHDLLREKHSEVVSGDDAPFHFTGQDARVSGTDTRALLQIHDNSCFNFLRP